MNGSTPDITPPYAGDSAATPDTISTVINSITTSGGVKIEELMNITTTDSTTCSSQVGTTSPAECAKRVLQWYTGSSVTYTLPSGLQSPSRDPSVCGGFDKCGPLGAIYRTNPLIVPPPEPNSAEQSFSNNRPGGTASFYSQYKTRPTMLYAQTTVTLAWRTRRG